MKIGSAVLLALLPSLSVATPRPRHGGARRTLHTRRRRVQHVNKTRRNRHLQFGSKTGGLMKMDYIKDWRNEPVAPSPPTPTPPAPTPPTPTPPAPTPPAPTPPAPTPPAPTPPAPTPPAPTPPVPTQAPTEVPTPVPTRSPVTIILPTRSPTDSPTDSPVDESPSPTRSPTGSPTDPPVDDSRPPTRSPTESPTPAPTPGADTSPTDAPTSMPVGVCDALDFLFLETPDDEELDIGLDGYTSGDVYTFFNNTVQIELQDIGTSSGRCIVLQDETDADNLYCTIEFEFGDGNVVAVQGVFFELIKIGGAGCYDTVQGYIDLADDPRELGRYGYDFQVEDGNGGCPQSEIDALFANPWIEEFGQEEVDWNGDGINSSGDVYVFDGKAVITNAGAEGFLEGECMILFDPVAETADADNPFCVVTFYTVNGDSLQMQGNYNDMVITSGLGCFWGATGSVVGSVAETGFQYDLDSSVPNSCTSGLFDQPWVEEFGDLYIDYVFDPGQDDDFFSPGDAYVLQYKEIAIPSIGSTGTLAGKCFVLPDSSEVFCNIVFTIGTEGSIAVQGFFNRLLVVGGSGCFQDLSGSVSAVEGETNFTYTWSIL